jgi:hypothetical protein
MQALKFRKATADSDVAEKFQLKFLLWRKGFACTRKRALELGS